RDDSGESRMGEISMSGSTRERGAAVIGLRTFHPAALLSTLLARQTRLPAGSGIEAQPAFPKRFKASEDFPKGFPAGRPGWTLRILCALFRYLQGFRLDLDRYPTILLDMVNSGIEPAADWAREAMTNSAGDQCEMAVVDGGFAVTVTSGQALLSAEGHL
ncbi:MAG: hypothetical protein ACYDC1_23780, partial [Limisphaerales bacterium]